MALIFLVLFGFDCDCGGSVVYANKIATQSEYYA